MLQSQKIKVVLAEELTDTDKWRLPEYWKGIISTMLIHTRCQNSDIITSLQYSVNIGKAEGHDMANRKEDYKAMANNKKKDIVSVLAVFASLNSSPHL